MFILLYLKNIRFVVVGVYRLPNGNLNFFLQPSTDFYFLCKDYNRSANCVANGATSIQVCDLLITRRKISRIYAGHWELLLIKLLSNTQKNLPGQRVEQS